mmetsp:Transcript_2337/g.4809  ORF Transcript_2337/g.4809 Transcript_2337/m.4809 type:complete len:370 (-) Transcript_2337:1006-2115(-)
MRSWRRRRGTASSHGLCRSGVQDGLRVQAVPDPEPHGGGPGRHQRSSGQHDGGRLALAHVRHGERLRLAGRPRRDPLHVQGGPAGRARAGVLRFTLFADRGREDLPARVWGAEPGLWQGGPSVPLRLRRGPHGARDAAHVIRAVPGLQHHLPPRVLCAGPDHGRRQRAVRGGDGALHGGRHPAPHQRHQHGARHGGLRPGLLLGDVCAHLHRGRQRHGLARGSGFERSRVRAVPPDGHLRRGVPHDGGVPRGGRHAEELGGGAVHGALRALCQGLGVSRRSEPRHDDGDPRGARVRSQERPHLPPPRPLARRLVGGALARHLRDGGHLCGSGRNKRAHPVPADGALQHGRRAHQPLRGGGEAGEGPSER